MLTTTCNHCGYEVPLNKAMCPNCGTPIGTGAPTRPNGQWPPAPTTDPILPTPEISKLITGTSLGDLIFGFIACFFIVCWPLMRLSVLGLALAPVIYLVIRKPYPTFARGFGLSLLTIAVVLLGAFAVCIYAFSQEH